MLTYAYIDLCTHSCDLRNASRSVFETKKKAIHIPSSLHVQSVSIHYISLLTTLEISSLFLSLVLSLSLRSRRALSLSLMSGLSTRSENAAN
jgi:hypothetical protein